ncbi:MAG: hypothetical protein V8Q91_07990 [Bilophila wadsworthia]|uniref:hypothetical protein n=1 Tax=Bilophila wadsworthia TaxID=35833 RepID=UPI00300ED25F
MIAGTVFSIGISVVGRESEFLFQRSIIAGYFDRFLASELDIAVTALTEKVDNVFLGKPLVAHPEGDVLGFRCDAAPRHFVDLESGIWPSAGVRQCRPWPARIPPVFCAVSTTHNIYSWA